MGLTYNRGYSIATCPKLLHYCMRAAKLLRERDRLYTCFHAPHVLQCV